MPVQNGFGVNYTNAQISWVKDIKYFKAINLNNIRPHQTRSPSPWAQGTPDVNGNTQNLYAFWRLCAQTFTAAGFYVTFGASYPQNMGSNSPFHADGQGGGLTATVWSQFHDSVVAEAAYMQSIGMVLGDFSLGNELEGYTDGTTLTSTQLNANIRQLALDVKAVYTLAPISYSSSSAVSAANSDWLANGLGGLDLLSIHTYGVINHTNGAVSANTFSLIASFIAAFGSSCYISEANLDAGSSNYSFTSVANQVTAMTTLLNTYVIPSGVNRFILYKFEELLNNLPSDYSFAQLYPTGSMNPMWFDFFTSQPMFYTPRSATVSRGATPNRSATPSRGATPTRNLIFS